MSVQIFLVCCGQISVVTYFASTTERCNAHCLPCPELFAGLGLPQVSPVACIHTGRTVETSG